MRRHIDILTYPGVRSSPEFERFTVAYCGGLISKSGKGEVTLDLAPEDAPRAGERLVLAFHKDNWSGTAIIEPEGAPAFEISLFDALPFPNFLVPLPAGSRRVTIRATSDRHPGSLGVNVAIYAAFLSDEG